MPDTAQDLVYLAQLSPRDVRFDERRREAARFEALYRMTAYDTYPDRIRQCSSWLDFALQVDDTGICTLKLQAASFCRVRLCPMCQWRRSMMWQAKALQIIPKVLEVYPKSRFIFLTLTVKNCELNELRDTLKWMHNSWTKLTKRKEFALVQGWVRSVEVTRGSDDTAHPHYHALLMVKPSYFSTGYVPQKRWTEIWQDCLGVTYTPIVDVRSVRSKSREKGTEDAVLMSAAICETFKYSVKPAECLVDDSLRKMSNSEWLSGLTSQLFKTRAIATGGVLKQYFKELEEEPEDLIHADENGLTSVDEESPRLAFGWRERTRRYVMTNSVKQVL